MGEGKVIHFTQVRNSPFSSSVSKYGTRCSVCEASDSRKRSKAIVFARRSRGRVMMSCLGCFLAGGSLYRYGYSVSERAYTFQIRGGTCTTEASSPPLVVMERALNSLEKGFGEYNVFTNNCEDFAVFCKIGRNCRRDERWNCQASSVLGAAAQAVASYFFKEQA